MSDFEPDSTMDEREGELIEVDEDRSGGESHDEDELLRSEDGDFEIISDDSSVRSASPTPLRRPFEPSHAHERAGASNETRRDPPQRPQRHAGFGQNWAPPPRDPRRPRSPTAAAHEPLRQARWKPAELDGPIWEPLRDHAGKLFTFCRENPSFAADMEKAINNLVREVRKDEKNRAWTCIASAVQLINAITSGRRTEATQTEPISTSLSAVQTSPPRTGTGTQTETPPPRTFSIQSTQTEPLTTSRSAIQPSPTTTVTGVSTELAASRACSIPSSTCTTRCGEHCTGTHPRTPTQRDVRISPSRTTISTQTDPTQTERRRQDYLDQNHQTMEVREPSARQRAWEIFGDRELMTMEVGNNWEIVIRPPLPGYCFSCGGSHHYNACPNRRGSFCYRCGIRGTTLAACPVCARGWIQQGPFFKLLGRNVPREKLPPRRDQPRRRPY